ncbi:hypothetical protein PR048_021695 [Dryococelus australis]|uniref:Uncharacterized protein n=1 Tax=Dryococelus australis TaxID=614101 RepID=A0ABQ9GZ03_9NEOP|nr:hypothetical protein PR048_021695 [Dryococelus australis]
MSAYTRQKTKSKYKYRIRLEIASQKQSSDTYTTPYDRVKRCRERKINIKASERMKVDVFTQNKRPRVAAYLGEWRADMFADGVAVVACLLLTAVAGDSSWQSARNMSYLRPYLDNAAEHRHGNDYTGQVEIQKSLRLEIAFQKQFSDTHKTSYDRVKRCREHYSLPTEVNWVRSPAGPSEFSQVGNVAPLASSLPFTIACSQDLAVKGAGTPYFASVRQKSNVNWSEVSTTRKDLMYGPAGPETTYTSISWCLRQRRGHSRIFSSGTSRVYSAEVVIFPAVASRIRPPEYGTLTTADG